MLPGPRTAERAADREMVKSSRGEWAISPLTLFGVVLPWREWEALGAKLDSMGVDFLERPVVLHESTPEEQAKLYIQDPSHNVIEIKAYRDFAGVLGTQDANYGDDAA